MMRGIEARGRRLGEIARERAIARGVERVREAVPGIEVSGEADGIVLRGQGLAWRWVEDARLRWIGSLLR